MTNKNMVFLFCLMTTLSACALEVGDSAAMLSADDAPLAFASCRSDADCDDGNVCTDDRCDLGRCDNRPNDAACNDGDVCTLNDFCFGGTCVGDVEMTLLRGDQMPASEGWTDYWQGGTYVSGAEVHIDTTLPNVNRAMHGRTLPIGALTTHDIEWKQRVVSGTVNPYDASASFMPAYSGWFGVPNERAQMLYFTPTEVGWADFSAAYTVDTTVDRRYRFSINAVGEAALYVDGTLALSRSGAFVNGAIGFGDQSNDTGIDGRFSVWSMRLVPKAACQ